LKKRGLATSKVFNRFFLWAFFGRAEQLNDSEGLEKNEGLVMYFVLYRFEGESIEKRKEILFVLFLKNNSMSFFSFIQIF